MPIDSVVRLKQLNQPEVSGYVVEIIDQYLQTGDLSLLSGDLTGVFYPLNNNPAGYINTGQTGNFADQNDLTNLQSTILIDVGNNYYLTSNPSGFMRFADLTGVCRLGVANAGGLYFIDSGRSIYPIGYQPDVYFNFSGFGGATIHLYDDIPNAPLISGFAIWARDLTVTGINGAPYYTSTVQDAKYVPWTKFTSGQEGNGFQYFHCLDLIKDTTIKFSQNTEFYMEGRHPIRVSDPYVIDFYGTRGALYNYPTGQPAIIGFDVSGGRLYSTGYAVVTVKDIEDNQYVTLPQLLAASGYLDDADNRLETNIADTGSYLLSLINDLSGNMITGTGVGGGCCNLGVPTDGDYGDSNGNVANILSGDRPEDAIDKIDTILGKLVPPKPPDLSATPLVLSPVYFSAYEQGTTTLRTQVTYSPTPTGTATGFYNGDTGILSALVNNIVVGQKILSTGSDVGLYSGLRITADQDYWAGVPGRQGFWDYLSAQVFPVSGLPTGKFTLTLSHSDTGPSSTIGYKDITQTPSCTFLSIQTGVPIIEKLDGVPYLTTGCPINVTTQVFDSVAAYYMNPCLSLTSSVSNNISVPTTGAPRSGESLILSGTLNVVNGVWSPAGGTTIIATAQRPAGYVGQAFSGVNMIVDSRSTPDPYRKVAQSGQFPIGSLITTYDNNTLLSTNEELQMINDEYQYPLPINYSTYRPVGPDYSHLPSGTYNNTRWALFFMGLIPGNTTNHLTFTINGAQNFGTNPLVSGMSFYVKANTAGWIDGNAAYPGVGNPTNNGDPALVVANSTATSRYVTLGTNEVHGFCWVRIGFPVNSDKRFTSISVTPSGAR